MEEIWKDIKGYENLYQVSNLGRVRSLDYIRPFKKIFKRPRKGRILSLSLTGSGYPKCTLCGINIPVKYVMVHRLVAKAFIKNPKSYKILNHKDENKLNNYVTNLEWCDYVYNARYSLKKIYYLKSPDNKEVIINNLSEFCFINNLCPCNMSKVASGKRRIHKGWTRWEK